MGKYVKPNHVFGGLVLLPPPFIILTRDGMKRNMNGKTKKEIIGKGMK